MTRKGAHIHWLPLLLMLFACDGERTEQKIESQAQNKRSAEAPPSIKEQTDTRSGHTDEDTVGGPPALYRALLKGAGESAESRFAKLPALRLEGPWPRQWRQALEALPTHRWRRWVLWEESQVGARAPQRSFTVSGAILAHREATHRGLQTLLRAFKLPSRPAKIKATVAGEAKRQGERSWRLQVSKGQGGNESQTRAVRFFTFSLEVSAPRPAPRREAQPSCRLAPPLPPTSDRLLPPPFHALTRSDYRWRLIQRRWSGSAAGRALEQLFFYRSGSKRESHLERWRRALEAGNAQERALARWTLKSKEKLSWENDELPGGVGCEANGPLLRFRLVRYASQASP
ncbi:MAG: hypothetical protein VYD19_10975 [Myxococcota bacterium]|nr:hypothetical protein [Myxococcota bacterium]